MRTLSLIVGLLLLWAAPSPAQTKPKIERDIVYRTVGTTDVKLDVARPTEGKGPFPVVLCVHGGAWRMGNKRDMHDWLDVLARQGYVAISVGYRLAPEHVFPAQIEDCKTAVRFVRANAERFGIDKNRVGVLGYSAGGHLVSLLGLTDAKAGFDGTEYAKESSAVQAVVDYFGPKDLAAYAKDDTAQRSTLGPLLGAKYTEKPALHNAASPIQHVKKGSPPWLLFHGTKDWLVDIEQTRAFAKKLKDVDANVTFVEVPGEGHGWTGATLRDTTRQTIEFFAAHLKK